ncbi:MAG: PHB depolymerase family esterase [Acidimicrobiales bacterium]
MVDPTNSPAGPAPVARRAAGGRRLAGALVVLVAAVGTVTACTAAPTSAPATTATPATTTVIAACRAGDHELVHDGVARRYRLAVPDGATAPPPLVVDLHGHGGSIEKQDANTGLSAAGTTRGFAVVTPQALGEPSRWNFRRQADQPDDLGFLDALLTDLIGRGCADPDRIYAAGHSNGAAFAAVLACSPPNRLAAVAMVSATTPAACPDGIAPAVLAIAGTADPTVPYDGKAGVAPPANATIDAYADRYGCSVPTAGEPWPGVRRRAHLDCRGGAAVVLDTVEGGLHPWPGGPAAQLEANSAAGRTFPATEEVLTFFDGRRRTWPEG